MTRDPLDAVRPEIRALRAYRFDPVPEGLRAKLDFNESPVDVPDEAKDAALAALRARRFAPLPGVRLPGLRAALAIDTLSLPQTRPAASWRTDSAVASKHGDGGMSTGRWTVL